MHQIIHSKWCRFSTEPSEQSPILRSTTCSVEIYAGSWRDRAHRIFWIYDRGQTRGWKWRGWDLCKRLQEPFNSELSVTQLTFTTSLCYNSRHFANTTCNVYKAHAQLPLNEEYNLWCHCYIGEYFNIPRSNRAREALKPIQAILGTCAGVIWINPKQEYDAGLEMYIWLC